MLLRAFIHVCNPPQPHALPPEIFSMTVEAAEEAAPLYRPRALTATAAFEFTGALQFWRVPVSGVYRITARGAKAADGACRCAFPLALKFAPSLRNFVTLLPLHSWSAQRP